MLAWVKKLFPEKIAKEIPMLTLKTETKQLKRAVKNLSAQADTVKQEMSGMLDDVLKEVGRKHHK